MCIYVHIYIYIFFNKVNVFYQSGPPSKVFPFAKCPEKVELSSGFQLPDCFDPGRLRDNRVCDKQPPWQPETQGPGSGSWSPGLQHSRAPPPATWESPGLSLSWEGQMSSLLGLEGSFYFLCRQGPGWVRDLSKVMQSEQVTWNPNPGLFPLYRAYS